MQPTLFLRRILALDAVTCIAMGMLLATAAGPLADLLALPQALLFEAGLVLLPFALFVLWARKRSDEIGWPARVVALVNCAWVIASFALLAVVTPNMLGIAFVTVQALTVAGIAALQIHGLGRAQALA